MRSFVGLPSAGLASTFPADADAVIADIVVVGAGTMGAWTALEARRRGASTTLIDAFGAGNSRATSGDETRIIRSSHGPDALYTRWSRLARDAWIALGDEIGERLFVQAGMLWFANRKDGRESESEATLRRLRIPVEHLSADETRRRWPQVATDDLDFVLFEPDAGLLMARRGVAAVARGFEGAGGAIELGEVRPGTVDGRRLRDVVFPDGRRMGGDTFVFAAGPWLPGLFPDLLRPLIRVTRQDVYYVGPPAGDGRFGPGSQPCWVDYDQAFYGIPDVERRGFKVAPDEDGPPFNPTHGERVTAPETAALMRSYLALRFPALAAQPIVETRVCQYEATPDTHFVIDRHPDYDNVWIAGGGSGHAFKHGPVIGRYIADLLGLPADPGVPDRDPLPVPDDDRFSVTRPRHTDASMRTGSPRR